MFKIVHLSSAHPRFDTRIFVKQCSSLTKKYETYLIVADGKGNETVQDVNIVDVGFYLGRKNRILNATKAVYKKAIELNADLYHLHDPELIPVGLKLKKLGKKVIFDAHEDLPNQIQSKHYLKPITKKILSFLVKKYEQYACSKLDGIVAATPFIRDKFLNINTNTIDINNYPIVTEFKENNYTLISTKKVCYIGGLADVRGINEIINAIDLVKTDTKLVLAGSFDDPNLELKIKQLSGWAKTDFLGYLDRSEISNVLSTSIAGLVVLHPTQSYLDALPVKMFEYMCAGIPVIASDFPLWRSIINDAQCGKCIDPLNPLEIAKAIDFFHDNPNLVKMMGENGKNAVIEKYNWFIEESKLFTFYENMIE